MAENRTPSSGRFDHEVLIGRRPDPDNLLDTERIRGLRADAGRLALQPTKVEDDQYALTQGLLNFKFLRDFAHKLPTVEVDVDSTTYDIGFLVSSEAVLTVKDMDFYIKVPADDVRLNSELLSELSGIRSAVVWVQRDAEDVVDGKSLGTWNPPARFKLRDLLIPYVIVGAAASIQGDTTEVLLLPLEMQPETDSTKIGYVVESEDDKVVVYGQSYAHSSDLEYNLLSNSAVLYWLPHILKAEMPHKQYSDLLVLQEQLLGTGLNEAELSISKDDKSFKVDERISILKAIGRSAQLLQFRRGPSTIGELKFEEFDMHLVEQVSTVTPEIMMRFRVLNNLRRLSSMLGRDGEFTRLHEKWLQNHLKDPMENIAE